jgi:hypothetical protein
MMYSDGGGNRQKPSATIATGSSAVHDTRAAVPAYPSRRRPAARSTSDSAALPMSTRSNV